MGIVYYAVNKANKTFYELGKGNWNDLNFDKEVFQDLEYLNSEILELVFDNSNNQEIIDHINNRVGPDLVEFFSNCPLSKIEIVNDCGDDHLIFCAKNYKCTGTRFGKKESKDYQQAIYQLNSHFQLGEANRKHYDFRNYLNHPLYEKY